MKTLTVVLILLLAVLETLDAQQDPETPRPRAGGYAGYNRNLHDAEFTRLPGVPGCCPQYERGQGSGISLGALYEYPLSLVLSLQLRAGYSSHGATLTTVEQTSLIVDGVPTGGFFEHRIDATLSNIGLEPIVALRILPELSLYAGVHAGYVMSRGFSQQERILEPEGRGTFIDSIGRDSKKRTRNEISGTIPEASDLYLAALGGVSYDLPLDPDGTLVASPEIFYTLGLSPVSSDLDWKASALRGGLSVRYRLPLSKNDGASRPPEIAQSGIPETPAEVIAPMLSAAIDAVAVDSGGAEHRGASILVHESIATRMTPLLSYLYFDDNSERIPERYSHLAPEQAASFTIASLHDEPTLTIYQNILNVVGRRLTAYPDATITLTGCNSGVGREAGNSELSRRRAESVRDYLVSVWGIGRDRISVEARDLPANPATPFTEPEKIEENRRVELSSSLREILDPVETTDTLRTIAAPTIRFKPAVRADAGVGGWTIVAEQNGRELRRFERPSPEIEAVDWNLQTEEAANLPVDGEPVVYSLVVVDRSGQQVETPAGRFGVERKLVRVNQVERMGEWEIERFTLLLFDFDNAETTSDDRRIAEQTKARFRPGSRVSVNGYADRTGADARNRTLSKQRAFAVGNILGGGDIQIDGIGEGRLLYDNTLPEGRAYCRTVEIVVATPVRQ